MVGGREMVVGRRAAFLSTMAGGRTPGGRCTSSRCVRPAASRHEFSVTSRSSHCAYSGGTTIKTVETTLTEAATDTVTGDSFVGRREIETNLLLSRQKHRLSRRSHAGSWLHIPAEHCSRTSHHIQPRWCNPTSHHLQPRWCNPTSHHLQPRWCNIPHWLLL
ncbi:unnamed protein product [Musa acuminata subsp. burmannicoides]